MRVALPLLAAAALAAALWCGGRPASANTVRRRGTYVARGQEVSRYPKRHNRGASVTRRRVVTASVRTVALGADCDAFRRVRCPSGGGSCTIRACACGSVCGMDSRCECEQGTVPDLHNAKCVVPLGIRDIYLDLVVLLDGSKSVGHANYDVSKAYVKALAESRLDASLHLSAYEFADDVGDGFHLSVAQKPNYIISDSVDDLRYTSGATNTAAALEAAGAELATYSRQHRRRAGADGGSVHKAVVLLTDGLPYVGDDCEYDCAIGRARRAGNELRLWHETTVIAVAVGNLTDGEHDGIDTLTKITGSELLIVRAADYGDIGSGLRPLAELLRACYECVEAMGGGTCDQEECAQRLP